MLEDDPRRPEDPRHRSGLNSKRQVATDVRANVLDVSLASDSQFARDTKERKDVLKRLSHQNRRQVRDLPLQVVGVRCHLGGDVDLFKLPRATTDDDYLHNTLAIPDWRPRLGVRLYICVPSAATSQRGLSGWKKRRTREDLPAGGRSGGWQKVNR